MRLRRARSGARITCLAGLSSCSMETSGHHHQQQQELQSTDAWLRTIFPDTFFHDRDDPPTDGETSQRPFVTLTYAQSLDAKIAGVGGRQLTLSGPQSMAMTHRSVARVLTVVQMVQRAQPFLCLGREGCEPSTTPSSWG